MNSSRFHYKQMAYLRWRVTLTQRRVCPQIWLQMPVPNQLAGRYPAVMFGYVGPAGPVLQVGDYVVSEEGDPRLWGHPDIRY